MSSSGELIIQQLKTLESSENNKVEETKAFDALEGCMGNIEGFDVGEEEEGEGGRKRKRLLERRKGRTHTINTHTHIHPLSKLFIMVSIGGIISPSTCFIKLKIFTRIMIWFIQNLLSFIF
jgi:hypothetical protein